jgi:hypothetical protein
MKLMHPLLLACLAAASPAGAYCLHNQLADRDVFVEQAQLRDSLREDRILRVSLKPGQRHCCRNLDCNPGGRSESTVELRVTVMGEPSYLCAPERVQTVKVTGDGLLRVLRNPYKSQLSPYIVRIRSGQKDLTGPRGVPCLEAKKGKP